MSSQPQRSGSGCGTLIAIIIVIALVVAALISVAALIDPFSWLPPVGEIFKDCQDTASTAQDECDLATRYPGFWPHVIANLAYSVAAVVAVVVLAGSARGLRVAQVGRYDSLGAARQYRGAVRSFLLAAAAVGVLAAIPIMVAAL